MKKCFFVFSLFLFISIIGYCVSASDIEDRDFHGDTYGSVISLFKNGNCSVTMIADNDGKYIEEASGTWGVTPNGTILNLILKYDGSTRYASFEIVNSKKIKDYDEGRVYNRKDWY